MHGDETPNAYLNRAQEYADALAVIGEPIKDKYLVMPVVLGLREEYNGLKTTITASQSPTAFSELHALLSDHDYMLGKTRVPDPSITPSFAAIYALGSPSMTEPRQAQLSELVAQLSALGFQVLPITPFGPQAFYGARSNNNNNNNNRSNNNNRGNCNNSRGNNNQGRDTKTNSYVTPDLAAMDTLKAYYGDDALHVGNGIIHQQFCPHTSEQNGFVERRNRHVVETGLTLLAQACVPQRFWHYAFDTAVYLINLFFVSLGAYAFPIFSIFTTLTDFISIISFTFESNFSNFTSQTSQTSPESSNGQPSLVSTTSIPTPPPPTPPPPPPPPITRQRPANLRQNPKQRVPYNPFANHATVLPTTMTEPTSYTVANKSPEWRQAMKEEYDALMKNGTRSLVPRASTTNVVD
ncbi:nucleotide-binding alpha-beta plait domain-containing protein, partial [Tanacetum coccineum]